MTRSVGFFVFRTPWGDDLLNQTEEPFGRHHGIEFRFEDRSADHVLCVGPPITASGGGVRRGWPRRWAKWTGRYEPWRVEEAYRALGRDPRDVTTFVFEPPAFAPDHWYGVARAFSGRVLGPDPRAPEPTPLPAVWTIDADLHALRAEAPPPKPLGLVAISSGARDLPGHVARLGLLERLRSAGVPMTLLGRGLPRELGPIGAVRSKATALRPARLALVVENYAEGGLYATEKLWDALLCWCLPVYWGSGAAEACLPPGAVLRLPDLGPGGVETVRGALADPGLWASRLPAIAEARRRILGPLRLAEWCRANLPLGA